MGQLQKILQFITCSVFFLRRVAHIGEGATRGIRARTMSAGNDAKTFNMLFILAVFLCRLHHGTQVIRISLINMSATGQNKASAGRAQMLDQGNGTTRRALYMAYRLLPLVSSLLSGGCIPPLNLEPAIEGRNAQSLFFIAPGSG
jgi:hypothetical protein